MSGEQEVRYWRALAAYLADCHAATAEALPKSASKSSHIRMKNICRIAAAALSDGSSDAPLSQYWNEGNMQRVCERLTAVVKP